MKFTKDWLPGDIQGNCLHKKMDSKTKVEWLFHNDVSDNSTEKVVEKRTGDNVEYVEHAISKAFQHVQVSF